MARSREELRERLAAVSLFRGLPEPELDAILEMARTRSVKARTEIFHERDAGTQVYIILSGRLKALTTSHTGDDVVFGIMDPGEVFGELGFLGGGTRTATVVTLEPSELLVIDRREFLPLLKRHPNVAIRVMEILAERLRNVDRFVKETMFLNLPVRLARRLLSLSESYGEPVEGGIAIRLRLSQEELGDMVATTRESINKQLRAWQRDGIASMERGVITLHAPKRLQHLASLVLD